MKVKNARKAAAAVNQSARSIPKKQTKTKDTPKGVSFVLGPTLKMEPV
jgi:hypothetical protein